MIGKGCRETWGTPSGSSLNGNSFLLCFVIASHLVKKAVFRVYVILRRYPILLTNWRFELVLMDWKSTKNESTYHSTASVDKFFAYIWNIGIIFLPLQIIGGGNYACSRTKLPFPDYNYLILFWKNWTCILTALTRCWLPLVQIATRLLVCPFVALWDGRFTEAEAGAYLPRH